jgi:serine/threonine protein kinase
VTPVEANAAAAGVEPPAAAVRREKPSWELEPGTEIAPGRTVLKPIGGGSAYEVFLVWDERLLAVMVAKVLRPDHAEDPGALRDLEREAEALRRLAHPVLVRGFDLVLGGPLPHVMIEHLEGPTLRRLVKRGGPLPSEQLLPLIAHVASALHYMAAERMVHLDVKPANIVMGVPPRLIDLSVARDLDRAARISGPVGTDPYMAPEQCDPKAHRGAIGPLADVWGLGATAWWALLGHAPFPRPKDARESGDLHARFPQLRSEPRPLGRDVPAPVAGLLARMLDKDPARRPTAAEAVAELEPVIAAMPQKLVLAKRGARFK